MMEHWNKPYEEISNPISYLNELDAIAKSNSEVYLKVFSQEPDSSIKTYADLDRVRAKREENLRNPKDFLKAYEEEKGKIQG